MTPGRMTAVRPARLACMPSASSTNPRLEIRSMHAKSGCPRRIGGRCGRRDGRALPLTCGVVVVELRGFEPLTPCMPSRNPGRSAPTKPRITRHPTEAVVVTRGVSRGLVRLQLLPRCCPPNEHEHAPLGPRRWRPLPCEASAAPTHSSPAPRSALHRPSSSALTGRGDVLPRMASQGRCADGLLT